MRHTREVLAMHSALENMTTNAAKREVSQIISIANREGQAIPFERILRTVERYEPSSRMEKPPNSLVNKAILPSDENSMPCGQPPKDLNTVPNDGSLTGKASVEGNCGKGSEERQFTLGYGVDVSEIWRPMPDTTNGSAAQIKAQQAWESFPVINTAKPIEWYKTEHWRGLIKQTSEEIKLVNQRQRANNFNPMSYNSPDSHYSKNPQSFRTVAIAKFSPQIDAEIQLQAPIGTKLANPIRGKNSPKQNNGRPTPYKFNKQTQGANISAENSTLNPYAPAFEMQTQQGTTTNPTNSKTAIRDYAIQIVSLIETQRLT
jgi:hypothetical protein